MQFSGSVAQQGSFELTFTILQGGLNFNVADVTSNVADVTLCESLPSIEDK